MLEYVIIAFLIGWVIAQRLMIKFLRKRIANEVSFHAKTMTRLAQTEHAAHQLARLRAMVRKIHPYLYEETTEEWPEIIDRNFE